MFTTVFFYSWISIIKLYNGMLDLSVDLRWHNV